MLPPDSDPGDEALTRLNALTDRRQALEQALAQALAVERLRLGLGAILDLSRSHAEWPPRLNRLIDELDPNFLAETPDGLLEELVVLDDYLAAELDGLVRLGEALDINRLADPASMERIQGHIDRFRRAADTALALRLLLHRRGSEPPPFVCRIPLVRLQQQIGRLGILERRYRDRLLREMLEMRKESLFLIRQYPWPTGTLEQLRGVVTDLERNLKHLAGGGRIERMPLSVEIIEIGGEPDAPRYDPTRSVEQAPPATDLRPVGRRRRPLLCRIYLWLTTSWGVSWRALKYEPILPGGRQRRRCRPRD